MLVRELKSGMLLPGVPEESRSDGHGHGHGMAHQAGVSLTESSASGAGWLTPVQPTIGEATMVPA